MPTAAQQLEAINAKLDIITARLDELALGGDAPARPAAVEPLPVDLDGPRGNPEVRFIPKRWEGKNYKGFTFSDTEPSFLLMLAETFDYFARKEDEEGQTDKNGAPKSKWTRLDAARARGWAERLAGKPEKRKTSNRGPVSVVTPGPQEPFNHAGVGAGGGDDIPF